jgi:hypothetical protein
MLRRYPETLRWRQALPPLFVLGMLILIPLAFFFSTMAWLLLAVLGLYLFVLLMVGLQVAIKQKRVAFVLGVPLAIACMHFSWGSGFLWGLILPPKIK